MMSVGGRGKTCFVDPLLAKTIDFGASHGSFAPGALPLTSQPGGGREDLSCIPFGAMYTSIQICVVGGFFNDRSGTFKDVRTEDVNRR
jgi:hypothetical protein